MNITDVKLSPEKLQHLLLQYKYHSAIRRVARGVTHNYNNIFTGLGGQTTILQQETALIGNLSGTRGTLSGDLLQRGIEQTAILYGFSRDGEDDERNLSPLLLATKALELLNSISRVHRFTLKVQTRREKLFCNIRDIVLILFYLGENCVDATPDGGEINLEIIRKTPAAENTCPMLAFCFRDHGQGFPESFIPSLHTPFVSTRNDSPLRGLGLYAAGILARKHHGQLTIERSTSKETMVSAVFPAFLEEVALPPETHQKSARKKHGDDLRKHCFLVVEDDEAMRTLLLHRLQRRGHMVFCVNCCAEALEEYENLYDIITTVLMDVGLRDNSGFECHKKILAINPQARVIFMSGQHEMIPSGLAENSAFLQKPFTIDQLEKAVQDIHV